MSAGNFARLPQGNNSQLVQETLLASAAILFSRVDDHEQRLINAEFLVNDSQGTFT